DKDEAKAINEKLKPLVEAMFVETNPIPVKKACELLGLCSGELRLPLCDMEESNLTRLKNAMEAYGLLKTV
ncbi:MAG: dihydrodipicolinate synthase family protein, partial [Candidatus Omnitrophica bacterium]|nr:dihydrodipicolinate synthase family protein [Candidatus Omnitrophota bacterium]